MKNLFAGSMLIIFLAMGLLAGCGGTTPTGPTVDPPTATPTATSTPVMIPITITYSQVSPSNGSVTCWGNAGLGGYGIFGQNLSMPVSTCSSSTTVVYAPFNSYAKIELYSSWSSLPTTCVSSLIVSTPLDGPITTLGTGTTYTRDCIVEIFGVGKGNVGGITSN